MARPNHTSPANRPSRPFGLLVAWLMKLFAKKRKPTTHDLKQADFSTNTQKMGLRFSEKIRNAFRKSWLKKG